MSYYITTDATCDLPNSLYEDYFKVIPMPFTINNIEYGIEKQLDIKEFYNQIRGGAMPTTSLITEYAHDEIFREILNQGLDILHISFSSQLSATQDNAQKAATALRKEFPNRKIYVIDSKCAALGEGLLVYYTLKARKDGKNIDDNYTYATDLSDRILHYVTAEDLFHLQRGGRVSKTDAVFGTMLHIKPIIYVNTNGKLVSIEKVNGRKKSLIRIVDKLIEKMDPVTADTTIFVAHADSLADAEFVAKKITEKSGVANILIDYIGPVIGTHAGPGTIAIFAVGSNKIDPKDETLN